MDKTTPKIGTILDGSEKRDAVHIAVMPMIATGQLMPGQRLENGIVDPYLPAPVEVGQRYFLFLYPGTVTGLRHVWTHSAFPEE